MSKLVYLLEDDAGISELVRCALEMANIEISCYGTVAEFERAFSKEAPAVCLLDIMLPDGNGIDLLQKIKRTHPEVICILLSALSQETDKVKGLNMGADDYIAKPFGILELTARVNVALRRTTQKIETADGLVLDEGNMSATLNGKDLCLNNKEYQLLKYCMENANRILTREMMLNAVWGYEEGETRTVDSHIARLRKRGINCFETVFGVGYKFVVNKERT